MLNTIIAHNFQNVADSVASTVILNIIAIILQSSDSICLYHSVVNNS